MNRPLRLVEFTKAFYLGGTEAQVLELLRGLGRLRRGEAGRPAYEVEVCVLEEIGPLLEDLWKLSVLPQTFPLNGSFLSAASLVQIGKLAAWLRRRRIDLVHAHDFYSTLLAVPAARLSGTKVIVGRLDLLHWHGPARSAGLAWLTRWADHVVANAEAIRDHCVERERIPKHRITLIRNGLDLPRFDERRKAELERPLPVAPGRPFAVHVANMSHAVKRQEDVLDALALGGERLGGLEVVFVGDGARRPWLEARAKELGLERRAHFLGLRTDVPAVLARATFGILSSNREGLSNAVIEGMAAGLPMVVTRVGGNPELVEHGVRGLVVDAEQPAALAAALGELLDDAGRARQMGRRAREFVEAELTAEQLVARHDAMYRRVVERTQESHDRSRGFSGGRREDAPSCI